MVIVNYLFFDYYGSCSITVDVRAITSGAQSGSTTDLTGCVFCPTPVLTGTATTASIAVLANPVIAAEILPATIAAGGSSHVTFGIPTRTGTVGL